MRDQHDRDFHLARAQAEWTAADKAASDLTRALHVQLAQLHIECAQSFAGDEIAPAASTYFWHLRRATILSGQVAA